MARRESSRNAGGKTFSNKAYFICKRTDMQEQTNDLLGLVDHLSGDIGHPSGWPADRAQTSSPDGEMVQDASGWPSISSWCTASLIIFASLWGLLAREGLVALNSYQGQSIASVIWAQGIGCLVMGWAISNKSSIESFYPPLYVAITTGFCGSVTTFSTWVLQVFLAFSNHARYTRSGIYSVMDALTQTGATIGISLIALQAGRKLGHTILKPSTLRKAFVRTSATLLTSPAADEEAEEVVVEAHEDAPVQSSRVVTPLNITALALGPLFWIGSALLLAFQTDATFRHVTFPLLLAPPGALLRWWLALFLNSSHRARSASPRWPLGTLAANLLATLIIAGVYVAQHVDVSATGNLSDMPSSSTLLGCQALYGVQEGFCGCLSTISTFAVEMELLKPHRRAFAYTLFSWFTGIVICVLIVGLPTWTLPNDAGYGRRCNQSGLSY